jgi:hypothetical protein
LSILIFLFLFICAYMNSHILVVISHEPEYFKHLCWIYMKTRTLFTRGPDTLFYFSSKHNIVQSKLDPGWCIKQLNLIYYLLEINTEFPRPNTTLLQWLLSFSRHKHMETVHNFLLPYFPFFLPQSSTTSHLIQINAATIPLISLFIIFIFKCRNKFR